MHLVFAGTPPFAAVSLRALLQRGHDILLVRTQPDRPAGRGMRRAVGAVKAAALELGIATQQPATLRDPRMTDALAALQADAWVVAAYGLLLPAPVLALPRLGCINVHTSLLPRWRGAAPIQRALLAGDALTGVSIMQMDAGLDTGAVYLRRSVPIESSDTGGSLHDKLAEVGAEAVCEVLDALAAGTARAEPQATQGVTYAHKVGRDEARIDWSRPAAELERMLRAFDPVPGAFTSFSGDSLKLWRGRVIQAVTEAEPGTVLEAGAEGVQVQCGQDRLLVSVLQRAGGKRLEASQFLRGHPLPSGTLLGER
jgi:methionyl-tRNA formyltransferase